MLNASPKGPARGGENLKNRTGEEPYSRLEEMVVSLIVHHPELIPTISGEGILEEFESQRLKRMTEGLESLFREKGRLGLLEALECLEEDLRERLCEVVFREGDPAGDPEKMLKDCLRKIRERRLQKDKRELLKKIREAEKGKREKELEALLMERQRLAERERALQRDRLQER
jgi:hypothetical protein